VLVDELRAIARRRKLLQAAAQLTRDREALPTSTISDRDFLEWALRVLDRPTRELLRMHYCQQLSYADIAKRTGTKVNTVRQQHKRAIDKLRRLLGYERRP
jgi:RNA polymerase sigma factor (sigma-70 family)